jgi:hypothetical protein
MLLLVALVPSVGGAQKLNLSQPRVAPGSAVVGEAISFEIRVHAAIDSPPERVWVEVAGRTVPLTGSGDAWARGVPFTVVIDDLPVGRHEVEFGAAVGDQEAHEKARRLIVRAAPEAAGGQGAGSQGGAGGGSPADPVTPEAPGAEAPGAEAPGADSPAPETPPTGSGQPAEAAPPGGTDDGAPNGGAGTMGPDAGPVVTSAFQVKAADPSERTDDATADSAAAVGGAVTTPDSVPPAAGSVGVPSGVRGAETHPWRNGVASLGTGLPVVLGGSDPLAEARLISVTMMTTGVVVMTFAFGFLARRRRDGEPTDPDEVVIARAAGIGTVATASLAPAAAAAPSWPVHNADDPESQMPRWRRPSLQAARKEDPAKVATSRVALTFATTAIASSGPATSGYPAVVAGMAPVDGLERRRIRYRLVRLLDGPDELRAGELGYLDEGDEVQLISQSGAYWLVLCPNGGQGWIHRMTLGDPIASSGPLAAAGAGPDDVDEDVLAAFLNRRAG